MKFLKLFTIIFFLVLIILSTFLNSINELWVYFYRDELYISIFSGLLIILLITIMKFRIKLQFTVIDISLLVYYLYTFLNLCFLNNQILFGNEFLSFTMLIITCFILKHFYIYEAGTGSSKILTITTYILIFIPLISGLIELIKFIPNIDSIFLFNTGLHNSGTTANFLASLVPLPFTILLLDKGKSKLIKIFSGIILILSITIIIIAKARSAWIACFISFLYVSSSSGHVTNHLKSFIKSKPEKIIVTTCFLFLLCASYFLYHLKKDSADGRLFIWKNCLQIAKERPVFGHGYNSYIKTYNAQQITYFKYHPDDINNGYLAADARYAFNDYIQIVIETGLIGLSLFLLFIISVFRNVQLKRENREYPFLLGSKACILSILISGIFSYPLIVGQIYFILLFFVAYISSNGTPVFSIGSAASKIITIILIGAITLTEFYMAKKFMAYVKWEKAFLYTNSENKQFSKASKIYEGVYPLLKSDPLFLFNYGTTLSNFNEYEKSVILLNEAIKIKSSYDLYLNLGRAYEGIHADSLAEQTYLKVAFLVPHKFVPRFNLFKLYQRTNQEKKALEMARTIKDMQIKVYSQLVGNIKSEAIKYMDK